MICLNFVMRTLLREYAFGEAFTCQYNHKHKNILIKQDSAFQ